MLITTQGCVEKKGADKVDDFFSVFFFFFLFLVMGKHTVICW